MPVGRKRHTIIQQKQYAMRLLHFNGMLEYIIVILAQLLFFGCGDLSGFVASGATDNMF